MAESETTIPQGWKLVPVEPTEEMMKVGWYKTFSKPAAKRVWQEMISVSPEAPCQNQ